MVMDQDAFISAVQKQLESEQHALPLFNPAVLLVQQELLKKNPNLHTIEQLISEDPALSGTLLKIANSSMYRGLFPTTTVRSALIRLGMSEVFRIVLTDIGNRSFGSNDRQLDGIMKKLWQHSRGCAFASGMLASAIDCGVTQHDAFLAGLLHDIGKLPILQVIARKKRKQPQQVVSEPLLVQVMDRLHAEQGYKMLQEIRVPEAIAIAARDHHLPDCDPEVPLLLLVRMANCICHRLGIGLRRDPSTDLLTTPEAIQLGLTQPVLDEVLDFLTSAPELAT